MAKRIIAMCMLLAAIMVTADAKIKFGVRGGFNITNMSFNNDLLKADNRTGFYLGLTTKIGLPMGFDIDASALYNQIEVNSNREVTSVLSSDNSVSDILKRKTFAVPLNLRKGFGFGDNLDVFVFAGPQFDFNIGGDSKIGGVDWKWESSAVSINLGAGVMLLNHLEVKANYNIPCGNTGEFDKNEIKEHITAKTGSWQIGLAYYF